MKTITKVLIAYLILSGLMPFAVGSMATFAPGKAGEMLHLGSPSPDTQKLLVFIGACLYSFAAVYAFAVAQLIKKRKAGFSMALLLSCITIGSGLFLMIGYQVNGFSDIETGGADLGKGILMLVLTIAAKRKESFA